LHIWSRNNDGDDILIYSWKKIVKHGLPLLTITIIVEVFAGQILQGKQEFLIVVPIFLISIPVINSVAGNVGSVLGARLASGLHVGYITHSLKDEEMQNNLIISIGIGFLTYFLLAIVIYFIASFSRIITEDLVLTKFVGILILTGFLLIFVVSIVSVLTAFISFKRGLDPDDMVAPVVTTVADVLGIIFLFVVLNFFGVII
jgi:mgtE-like transporter